MNENYETPFFVIQMNCYNQFYNHTSIDSSQRAPQTNGKLFFSNFKFIFELMAENRKIFRQVARREY